PFTPPSRDDRTDVAPVERREDRTEVPELDGRRRQGANAVTDAGLGVLEPPVSVPSEQPLLISPCVRIELVLQVRSVGEAARHVEQDELAHSGSTPVQVTPSPVELVGELDERFAARTQRVHGGRERRFVADRSVAGARLSPPLVTELAEHGEMLLPQR